MDMKSSTDNRIFIGRHGGRYAAAVVAITAALLGHGGALAQNAMPANGFVMQPTAAQVDASQGPHGGAATQRVSSKSIDAAFQRADRDGDGRLSRKEAEHFPALSQRFDQIDGNRDAYISRDEFNAAASN